MKCPKGTKVFNSLTKVVSSDTALSLFKKYNLKEDEIPFEKASNGEASYLFKTVLDKTKNIKRAVEVSIAVRTDKYKDTYGDWEFNPENYNGRVDENGEPVYEEVIKRVEGYGLEADEYIEDPDTLIEGFNTLEVESILGWGESIVLKSLFNDAISTKSLAVEMEKMLRTAQQEYKEGLANKTITKEQRTKGELFLSSVNKLLEPDAFKSFQKLLKGRLISEGYKEEKINKDKDETTKDNNLEDDTKLTTETVTENAETQDDSDMFGEEVFGAVWDDAKKMAIPVSDTVGFVFKTYLMNIPKVTYVQDGKKYTPQLKANILGFIDTYSHKVVFSKITNALADSYGTISQRVEMLEKTQDPVLMSIAAKLKDPTTPEYNRFRNLFYVATNLQNHNMVTVKEYSRELNDGDFETPNTVERQYRIINTDSTSATRSSLNLAREHQIEKHEESEGKAGILKISNNNFVLDESKMIELSNRVGVLAVEALRKFGIDFSKADRNAGVQHMLDNAVEIMDILDQYGIKLTSSQYEDLIRNPQKYIQNGSDKAAKFLKSGMNPITFISTDNEGGFNFITSLSNITDIDTTSSFVGNNSNPLEDRMVKIVLKTLYEESAEHVDQTFLNSSDNQVAKYGLPSFATQLVKKLTTKDSKFMKDMEDGDFTSTSRVVKLLKRGALKEGDIVMGVLDAISTSNNVNITRKEASPLEKLVMRLSLMANNGNDKFMHLMPLTFSDKSRNIIFKWPRINITGVGKTDGITGPRGIFADKDNNTKLKDANGKDIKYKYEEGLIGDTITRIEVNNALEDLIRGEAKRITRVINKRKEDSRKGMDIALLKGGDRFYLFPSLNKLLDSTDPATSILSSNGIIFNNDTVKLMLDEVHKDIQQEVKHVFDILNENFKSYPITKTLNKEYLKRMGLDTETLEKRNITNPDAYALTAIAADYVINNMIGTGEVVQLLSDPAQYFKRDEFGTWTTYLKRLGSLIGTGMDPSTEVAEMVNGKRIINNYENIAYFVLNDKYTSRMYNKYKKSLSPEIAKGYKNVNSTDAQELVTLKSYIVFMAQRGKIKEEVYDSINKKIMESYKTNKPLLLNSGEDAEIARLTQMDIIPQKPLYTSNNFNKETSSNDTMIVKSSFFPLIPQYTKDLEIDMIREKMEREERKYLIDDNNEEKTGNLTTVHLAFESAVKAGSRDKWDVFNYENDHEGNSRAIGLNKDKIDLMEPTIVKREGLKTQQEEGNHEDYKTISVSQMNQLITMGISEMAGFDLFIDDHVIKDGKGIREMRDKIKVRMMEEGLGKLEHSFGIKNGVVTNQAKFRDAFKEILVNEGISDNELQSLKFKHGAFAWPLDMSASRNKIVQKINSAISKKILRPELRGRSFVQGAAFGIKGKMNVSKLSDNENNVIFTSEFDTELKAGDIILNKKGKVIGIQKMQVILPWMFNEDINNFIGSGGKLDMSKIDKELLSLIGARIPNQGFSSMSNIEIVGFLPPQMKSLIILPDEITAQMGSDFDVDHLYTYMYNYKNVEDADGNKTLKIISEENVTAKEESKLLQNQYIRLHEAVLSHPDITKKMLTTLDLPDFQNFAKVAKAKEEEQYRDGTKRFVPLGIEYSEKEYNNAQAGKIGVAIEANALVFLAMAENKGLYPIDKDGSKLFLEVESEGEVLTLSDIDLGTSGGGVRSNADSLMMLLSEAVDNANNGNLAYLGYDAVNSGVYNLLIQMVDKGETQSKNKALSAETVALIMTQPAIQEITEELKTTSNKLGKRNSSEDMAIIQSVLKSYEENRVEGPLTTEELKSQSNSAQYKVASIFAALYNPAKTIGIANSVLKIETKGVGKDISSIVQKVKIYSEVINGKSDIVGLDNLVLNGDGELTEVGYGVYNSLNTARAIWGTNIGGFPMSVGATPKFNTLLDMVLDNNSSLSYSDIPFISKQLHESMLSHLLLKKTDESSLFKDNGEEIDKKQLMVDMLYGSNSLANRINRYKRTNNPIGSLFISNLIPSQGKTLDAPSFVEINTFALTQNAQTMLIASWMELYRGNAEQRSLALDLVRYSLMEGAKFSPRSIKMIRPLKILIESGHGLGLNSTLLNNINPVEVFKEYVEHYPKSTPELNKIDGIENKNNYDPDTNKVLYTDKVVFSSKNSNPPLYAHVRGKNKDSLYERVPMEDGFIYLEMNTKGHKKMSENLGEEYEGKSVFDYNNPNVKEKVANYRADKTVALQGDPVTGYFSNGTEGVSSFMSALDNITTPHLIPAARILKDLKWLMPNGIKYVKDPTLQHRGQQVGGSISLNVNKMGSRNLAPNIFKAELEEVLLHEIAHTQTSQLVDRYISGQLKGDEFRDIRIAMGNIEAVRAHLADIHKREINKIKANIKEKKESDLKDVGRYEPLTNLNEFMVALTNREFINFHKETPYKESTFGERILKYMTNLFENMIGAKLKKGTALYEAFGNFFIATSGFNEIEKDKQTKNVVYDTVTINGKTYGTGYNNSVYEIRPGNDLRRITNPAITKRVAVEVLLNKEPHRKVTTLGKEFAVMPTDSIFDLTTNEYVFASNTMIDKQSRNIIMGEYMEVAEKIRGLEEKLAVQQTLFDSPPKHEKLHAISKMGKTTANETVVIRGMNGIPSFMTDKGLDYQGMEKYAKENGMVYTLRKGGEKHFGNPSSHMSSTSAIIPAGTIAESVQNYHDWLTTDKFDKEYPQLMARKEWIVDLINSGKLKGKKLLYWKELGQPSHATVLSYLINNGIDSEKENGTTKFILSMDKTGKDQYKAARATAYVFANFGKDFNSRAYNPKSSSTLTYAFDARNNNIPVNSETYTKDDKVFASISGGVGAHGRSEAKFKRTVEMLSVAVEAGASILLDSSVQAYSNKYVNGQFSEEHLIRWVLSKGYKEFPFANGKVSEYKPRVNTSSMTSNVNPSLVQVRDVIRDEHKKC